MSEEEICCDICGDPHSLKYVQTLKCNHSYHYECIQKSFQCTRKKGNLCPLCRQHHGLLPIVNGLPKLMKGIHYVDLTNGFPEWTNTPCNCILKSGKRKGMECSAKCMLGFTSCKRHHTVKLKKKS